MKKLFIIIFFAFVAFTFCNKGLSPTGSEPLPKSNINFPIEVVGGELMGKWEPIDQNPLEAALVNPEALTGLVDSLVLNSHLSGNLIVEAENKLTFDSLFIQINPDVYVAGAKIPVSPFVEFIDTVLTYEQPWANVIVAPVKTTFLKIDTLGYSATADSLTMVTKPVGFPGFDFAEYYLLFRFRKK